jgi:RNA polymerase sigma-70 factor, ECF subfamily
VSDRRVPLTSDGGAGTVHTPAMSDAAVEDRALLDRAQDGDMEAFEALVERHEDRLYGLALRMTRSEADAAEVVQDTFLAAYQNLKNFRGEAAFGSWVHRIAANNALMRLRHQRVVDAVTEELRAPEFTERGSLAEVPEVD